MNMNLAKNVIKLGKALMVLSWMIGAGVFILVSIIGGLYSGLLIAVIVTFKFWIVGAGLDEITKLFLSDEEYQDIIAEFEAEAEAQKALED